MARISRFRKQVSDRSGFDFKAISLVKDGAWKVGGDERDTPPPSKLSLGGEGDVSQGDALVANSFGVVQITSTPAAYDNPVTYLTAAGGITPSFAHPWMFVVGSLENITLTADPKIVAGTEAQQLTLYGVGSTIRIANGTGLALMGSVPYVIGSGSIITFMYNTGGAVWSETSRTAP